ncbi:MAG: alpha/beta hydrolase [Rhodothermales bacterium]
MRFRSLSLAVLLATLAGCSGTRYADAPPLAFEAIDYGFDVSYALDDPRLAYIDVGEGDETILLVHGLASNAGFWRYTIQDLADAGYRVVAVDLPGFGKSAKGAYPYDMTFYAETLARFIQALDLDPLVYVGHSMGGQVGITLALERPDLIDRLVLAAPAGVEAFDEGEGAWLANVLTEEGIANASEEAIRRNLALNVHHWNPKWEWLVEERARMAKSDEMDAFAYAVLRSVHGMIDEPTSDRLGEIAVPTLVVYGQYDGLIPNPYLHPGTPRGVFGPGAEAIPYADLVEIPDAGHLLMIERPEAFTGAVLDYLRQRGVAS